MLTLAEILPEEAIRKLELLKQKQPTIKKQPEETGKSRTKVVQPDVEVKKVATENQVMKTKIVEVLAYNPRFVNAVWRGQERKVRKIVKDELRKQNLQIRKNFWWVYIEATRAVAMLPVSKSAGKKAAVAG